MKKVLSMLLVFTMLMAVLVGCAQGKAPEKAADPQGGEANQKAAVQNESKWPTGTVQLIVPAKAGGGTDLAARIFAKYLQEKLGKPFVIVNQPEGGGVVAAETARNAKPDGSTLLFYHTSLLVTCQTGMYDKSPVDDFTVASVLPTGGSYVLVVGVNSPYKTVDDLVKAAKEKPGQITLGVQTNGSTHFMAGLLMQDAGVEFKYVEAGSDTDKLAALQGGHIDATLVNANGAKQYSEAGKLRALATISGSTERDPFLPDLPSFHELGYKNSVYGIDLIVLGPKDSDKMMLQKINDSIKEACNDSEVQQQMKKISMPIRFMNIDESAERLKTMYDKIGKVAEAIGAKK